MAESGCLKDVMAQNVEVANDLRVSGESVLAGVRNTDLTSSSATTSNIDLTEVTADHKVILTAAFSAIIQLPQATANNIGMVIEIMLTADGESGDANTAIAFADSGSTVMTGGITTGIVVGEAAKEATSLMVLANAKRVVLDSNNVAAAGGAKGSHYKFTYVAANLVFLTGVGLVTGSTATAPVAATAFTTTGYS